MDTTFATAVCLSMGIPCRHYFRAWIDVQGLPFHISLIRPRWYQDPAFATESIPAICRTHKLKPQEFKFETSTIGSIFESNPIDTKPHAATPPPRTQTLPARAVFHNVDDLVQSLQDLHQRNIEESRREQILVISHKRCPHTARLTNAWEGRSQGGGGTAGISTRRRKVINSLADSRVNEDNLDSSPNPKKSRSGRTYKCALCRNEGHNRPHCPNIK
ncbi:hypothetical protein DFH09DRAFT_1291526 [Mycena vulgaris]|nr:hypothetical protein DFH09DRAFT_1291526 [Mycena vulgaris]